MSSSMFSYLVLWLHIDSVLNMIIGSGTPPSQNIQKASSTLKPSQLKPAESSSSSLSLTTTILIAVPVMVTVLGCAACLAYCKIKAG